MLHCRRRGRGEDRGEEEEKYCIQQHIMEHMRFSLIAIEQYSICVENSKISARLLYRRNAFIDFQLTKTKANNIQLAITIGNNIGYTMDLFTLVLV